MLATQQAQNLPIYNIQHIKNPACTQSSLKENLEFSPRIRRYVCNVGLNIRPGRLL